MTLQGIVPPMNCKNSYNALVTHCGEVDNPSLASQQPPASADRAGLRLPQPTPARILWRAGLIPDSHDSPRDQMVSIPRSPWIPLQGALQCRSITTTQRFPHAVLRAFGRL